MGVALVLVAECALEELLVVFSDGNIRRLILVLLEGPSERVSSRLVTGGDFVPLDAHTFGARGVRRLLRVLMGLVEFGSLATLFRRAV